MITGIRGSSNYPKLYKVDDEMSRRRYRISGFETHCTDSLLFLVLEEM